MSERDDMPARHADKPAFGYVLTTFNKRPWLEISLRELAEHQRSNSEVVIADGGSQDGSRELLSEYEAERPGWQVLHGSDRGEAHGWNRTILASRAELVKLITDDDVYDYGALEVCAEFLIRERPDVDVLVTPVINAAARSDGSLESRLLCPAPDATGRFADRRMEISTCGLGLFLRKSAIPLTGLFDPRFIWMDYEFLRRVRVTPVTVAWYTKPVVLRLHNEGSLSHRRAERMDVERRMIDRLYLAGRPAPRPSFINRLRQWKARVKAAAKIRPCGKASWEGNPPVEVDPAELFSAGRDILARWRPTEGEFVISPPEASDLFIADTVRGTD